MFTNEQMNIIQYCAEECERQASGEKSVYHMLNAWDEAEAEWNADARLSLGFIATLGTLVDPNKNPNGFRQIPIGVSDGFRWIEKAPWERVPDMLNLLIESYYEGNLKPDHSGFETYVGMLTQTAEDRFYYEYENIHPFRDGNGRTGKIIYNYLLGRLNDPIMPPNFFGSSNP